MSTELVNNKLFNDVMKSGASNFISNIRIWHSSMNIADYPASWNDWVIKGTNYGPDIRILIGPWRFAARRFETNSLVLQSFNIGENSKYDPETNRWDHTEFTEDYLRIKNPPVGEQDLPGMKRRNLVGFDFLFYLPDFKDWVQYFMAGASKNESVDVLQSLINNPNRVAILGQKDGKGNYQYKTPTLKILVDETPDWPEDQEDKFNTFIHPEVEIKETSRVR